MLYKKVFVCMLAKKSHYACLSKVITACFNQVPALPKGFSLCQISSTATGQLCLSKSSINRITKVKKPFMLFFI